MTTKPPSSSAPAVPRGVISPDELRAYIETVTDPIDRIRFVVQLGLRDAIQAEIERGTMSGQQVGDVVDAVADGVGAAAFAFIQKTVQTTSDNQHEYDKDFPQALGQFTNHLTETFVHLIRLFNKPQGTIVS